MISRMNNLFRLTRSELPLVYGSRQLQSKMIRTFIDQKMFNQDHYSVLGVQPSAAKEDIKKKYYQLTKQYHPDVNKGNKTNEEKFKQINAAWDILGDDKKRQEYDSYKGFFGAGKNTNNQGAGFNPFMNNPNDPGRSPFGSQGAAQNPFGKGSPFEDMDLDKLLADLKKSGVKLEDFQGHPQFREFNQMFGLNQQQPQGIKDKIALKLKQEAMKFMLRRMQDQLEKEILFQKEQREKQSRPNNGKTSNYQNAGSSSSSQSTSKSGPQMLNDMFSNFFKKK